MKLYFKNILLFGKIQYLCILASFGLLFHFQMQGQTPTREFVAEVTDNALYFNGSRLPSNNNPAGWESNDSSYHYEFGRALVADGDCITAIDGFIFFAWYEGGKDNRFLKISRYNPNTNAIRTLQLNWQHTGFRGNKNIGESHNKIAVGISPKDKTLHLLYDMHAYTASTSSNPGFYQNEIGNGTPIPNRYFRYSFSSKDVTSIPDSEWTQENVLERAVNNNDIGNYTHNSLNGSNNPSQYQRLTYPRFFINADNDLFFQMRVGGHTNGSYRYYQYNSNNQSWANYKEFNVLGAKNSNAPNAPNYNWGLYGDIKFLNGQICIGFQRRKGVNDQYKFQDGMFFARASNSDASQWEDSAGNAIDFPVVNPENLNLGNPEELLPSQGAGAGNNEIVMTGPYDFTVTERGDIHMTARVRDEHNNEDEMVHYYKPQNSSWRRELLNSNFGASNIYTSNNKIYLIGLDNGRIRVDISEGGENNFSTIYSESSSDIRYRHGTTRVIDGKIYFIGLENDNNSDSSEPLHISVIDLNLAPDDNPDNNCIADYEEQNGLVVIEAENRPAVGGWQERTTFSGFTGDGYLEWLGDDNFNNPGEGVISTTIQINDPGRYRFEWRSKVGEGDSPTESNDSWLKFPDASDFYGQQGNSIVYPKGSGQTPVAEGAGGDGYFKIYSSGTTDWTWSTRTSDNDAHNIFVEFDTPGVYTMLVSGRSRHHLIDRITLFKEGVNNRNLSLEETSCDATDNDTNQAPSVSFTSPTNNITLEEGYDDFVVVALPEDSDGTISTTSLFINDQFIRNENLAPYEWGNGNNVDETLNLGVGTHTFRVVATDNDGATAEDTFTLTVTAPNVVPTVNFTTPAGDLTVQEGYTSLELTAEALDSDGTIESVGLYVDGAFVRDENVAPYDFGQGNNVAETLGLTPGSYMFTVIATDNDGATAEDTFTLTVVATLDNEIPTVMFSDPSEDLTVQEGYTSLPLEASASDADGTIASVGLYIDGQFIRNDFDAPYTWGSGANQDETLGLAPGIYTLRVLAIDDEGATAEDTILLTVTALPNEIPTVEFTNPTGDLTLEEGYISLPLNAQALDSDGTIESVGLYIDGVFVRNENVAPYDFGQGNNVAETLGLTVGSYTFTVIATDDEGATAEDTFTLTVTAVAENQAPGVAFTTPFEETLTVEEGYDSLELVAEAFDDDGSIVSVGLYIDGVFIRNDFESQFNWGIGDNAGETLGLTAGTYTFTVIATDNEGSTAADTFILTVEGVLSIDTLQETRKILIYPNPANDQFAITGLPSEKGNLKIIDMLGRTVLIKDVFQENETINISTLSSATYLLVLRYSTTTISKMLLISRL